MKKLILLLVFLTASSLDAQWNWLNPLPQNNKLLDICFFNSSNWMAVGKNGALVLTTNSGINWAARNLNSNSELSSCCAINSTTGFIAGSYGTIFKTTNSGVNWVTTTLPYGANSRQIIFMDENTGWYFNTQTLYKTTNCGINWISMPFSITNLSINTVRFVNSLTGFAAGAPVYNSRFNIFKTTNGGLNWRGVEFPNNPEIQSIYFIDEMTGFAGGVNGVLAKTTNGGEVWELMSVSNTYGRVASIKFLNENTGYINYSNDTVGRIFKTTNAGMSFELAIEDSTSVFTSIYAAGNYVSSCGDKGRLISSFDNGTNWITNSGNIKTDYLNIKFQDEFNAIASGRFFNRINMYRTSNGGINWINYASYPDLIGLWAVHFVDMMTGYAVGGYVTQMGRSMRTTNAGVSWTELPVIPYRTLYCVNFLNANTGLSAGMQGLIARTTNAGENWTVVHSGGPYLHDVVGFINENTTYSTNSNGDVFRSTNGGINWSITANISAGIHHLIFSNESTGYLGGPAGIKKTTNGGYNWFDVKNGINCGYLEFYNAYTGYASGYSSEVLRTTDGGMNWIDETGFANTVISRYHFITSEIVYASGFNLLMKTTNGGVLLPVSESGSKISSYNLLSQNYPNPFNSSSKFKFEISKLCDVRITVYDITGREVSVIVNERLQPRTYETIFDGSGLTSGVYFYRMTAGEYVQTRRMVLIK